MKTPDYRPLNSFHKHEEDFNRSLSENLSILKVGSFKDDVQVEANVGTRRADIVAVGNDGTLVVECQFGKADWDHWGRLEAYARIKEANTAVLVAESFEELMIVTCDLRNQQDSAIDWYLIRGKVTNDELYIFNSVAGPAIDIQAEKTGIEYSEFWKPIREKGLFRGKQVPLRHEAFISKGVKGALLCLAVNKSNARISLDFTGKDMIQRRDFALKVLEDLNYNMTTNETEKTAWINFPVIDKGRDDVEDWDTIRQILIEMGTNIYQKISQSDL